MRLAGSPRETSCASEGEEAAALYNMACCWCRLGQPKPALACLEALLEGGAFTDFAALRADADLAAARGPALDALLAKHDGPLARLLRPKPADGSGKKGWLQW